MQRPYFIVYINHSSLTLQQFKYTLRQCIPYVFVAFRIIVDYSYIFRNFQTHLILLIPFIFYPVWLMQLRRINQIKVDCNDILSFLQTNKFSIYNLKMSVKVGVRVRPFNDREISLNSKCVVDMQNPVTILKANDKQAQRKFTFDYSFWSFDEFTKEPNGYFKPNGSKYADQKYVFSQVGQKVLENAYQGYHCCLFAYGQTGSGKSYSMIGFGQNKGIVPITCEELFKKIKDKKQGEQFEVNASMLQIYNEQIQDLTIDTTQRPQGGLKVRESKLLGIYVDGVKKHFVQSYEQIQKVMDLGTKNRTIAATQMNATSSRAHTIISVQFKQRKTAGATKTQKISVINLVDLAGSERQSKTGATGQRFKEAVGINLSLTTLGQVISILAENADGGNQFVPYRNSSLTRILQNALGGNSQTIMICAVSPAADNYQQTLSTLRYADQAKKIKNKPVVNESETDKLIRELKAENQRLKKLLQEKGSNPNNGPSNEKKTQQEEDDELEQLEANMNALNQKIDSELLTKDEKRKKEEEDKAKNKKQVEENRKGQEKLLDDAQIKKMQAKNQKIPPYFENISRDLIINKKLKILLEKNEITIGKTGCTPPNEIIFGGRDMKPKHAKVNIDAQGNVELTPVTEGCHLYLNGQPVKTKVVLKDLDRVIFGWNSVYLFKDKDHPRADSKVTEEKITWDFIKKEVQKQVDIDDSDTEDGGCCSIF